MRRKHINIHANKISSILLSVLISSVIVTVCCVFFSFITSAFIKNMKFSVFFSFVSLITGCCAGTYICGKYRRKSGLLCGTATGITLYLIICVTDIICFERIPDIKKLLLLALAGAIGGVAGVNSKRPKNLRD